MRRHRFVGLLAVFLVWPACDDEDPAPADHGVMEGSPVEAGAPDGHADGSKKPPWLTDIWGSGASDVWMVGWSGRILHFDGSVWAPVAAGTTVDLTGLWGSAAGDVWAVGELGTILHHDGSGWSTVQSSTVADLEDVWGTGPGDVWAVGDEVILHYDGSSWSQSFTPVDHNQSPAGLDAIHGASASDIWVGGERAAVFHYDGAKWTYSPPFESLGLYVGDVWMSGPGVVWAALSGFGIWRRDGAAAWKEQFTVQKTITSLWGTSETNIWAVGADGVIYHHDGSSWTQSPSGTTAILSDVWGSGDNDVWACGQNAVILHYDGTAWSVGQAP